MNSSLQHVHTHTHILYCNSLLECIGEKLKLRQLFLNWSQWEINKKRSNIYLYIERVVSVQLFLCFQRGCICDVSESSQRQILPQIWMSIDTEQLTCGRNSSSTGTQQARRGRPCPQQKWRHLSNSSLSGHEAPFGQQTIRKREDKTGSSLSNIN